VGNPVKTDLEPGLYLISTPIGAARDITLRALDILASADTLAAEDTRTLRKLMDIHGIPLADRPLISLHDHNAHAAVPRLMGAIQAGKSVVYASEAGTPLISDPGFDLTRAVVEEGHKLIAAPGPTAAIAALTLSGLPADRFYFEGFLPNKQAKRKSALETLRHVPGTLIFYESPKRVAAMLADAADVLGASRQAAVCRELTKKFENVRRGKLGDLATEIGANGIRGEIVVLIGQGDSESVSETDIDTALEAALETQSVRDAAEAVAAQLKLKRRPVYQRALQLAKQLEED
jgi:16S rRNA (cytidine1402-2'-O)-methyltransferase